MKLSAFCSPLYAISEEVFLSQSTLCEREMKQSDISQLSPARRRRNKIKVLIAMFFAVCLGALGDVSLKRGMEVIAAMDNIDLFHRMIATITNCYVIGGVVLLASFLILYLVSLSLEELSYVLPLTAGNYVLVTILAYWVLHEHVSPLRWSGSILVTIGIALVART